MPLTNMPPLVSNKSPTRENSTLSNQSHIHNTNVHDNASKNVSFALQGDDNDTFLPIPPEGLPFFRRARGCFSAEARADTRADHLDRLCDNGKPAHWAYGIGPMPSYPHPIARDLVRIRRRHALKFSRAVVRSLRESATASRRQGSLNLNTVQGIYADDRTGFDRASAKLTTLVSRDNSQEVDRLHRREELIIRSPITDDDIVHQLNGQPTASRSYAGVVANDPPQANNQEHPIRDANNGQARRNRRSCSRNRGRNNRNRSRERNNNQNVSRSTKLVTSARTTAAQPIQAAATTVLLDAKTNLAIKPADKGGAIVILNKEDYIEEGMRQLNDRTFYIQTDTDLSKKYHDEINFKLKDMAEKDEIDDSCSIFLSNPEYRTSQFYMLPKIHKRLIKPPGRPIVSGNGCPTERISQFVDCFLKPIVQNTRSYLKDTTHFLKVLNSTP